MSHGKFKVREELRQWLARGGGNHFVHELNHADSVECANHLYALGASAVYVTEIAKNAGLESVDKLAIVMPPDPSARQRLFDWYVENTTRQGYEPSQTADVEELRVYFF